MREYQDALEAVRGWARIAENGLLHTAIEHRRPIAAVATLMHLERAQEALSKAVKAWASKEGEMEAAQDKREARDVW